MKQNPTAENTNSTEELFSFRKELQSMLQNKLNANEYQYLNTKILRLTPDNIGRLEALVTYLVDKSLNEEASVVCRHILGKSPNNKKVVEVLRIVSGRLPELKSELKVATLEPAPATLIVNEQTKVALLVKGLLNNPYSWPNDLIFLRSINMQLNNGRKLTQRQIDAVNRIAERCNKNKKPRFFSGGSPGLGKR